MIGLSVLIALVLYIYFAKATARFVEKRTQDKLARYATLAVFVLMPTWDIIPGWLYFNHLCEKEGGTKIFKKTIEVDRSYFQTNGQVDEKRLSSSGDFLFERKDDRSYSPLFHIAKFENVLREKQTGEVLGLEIQLMHYGGWLSASMSPYGPVRRCDSYSPYRDVWTEVMKPKAATS